MIRVVRMVRAPDGVTRLVEEREAPCALPLRERMRRWRAGALEARRRRDREVAALGGKLALLDVAHEEAFVAYVRAVEDLDDARIERTAWALYAAGECLADCLAALGRLRAR